MITKKKLYLVLAGAAVMALFVWINIESTKPLSPAEAAKEIAAMNQKREERIDKRFPAGTSARLIFEDNDKIPVYRTLNDFDKGMRIADANDKSGAVALILDDRAFFVPAGTAVTITDTSNNPPGRFVEMSGGRKGWVTMKVLYPLK
jgi:hypothetical protein